MGLFSSIGNIIGGVGKAIGGLPIIGATPVGIAGSLAGKVFAPNRPVRPPQDPRLGRPTVNLPFSGARGAGIQTPVGRISLFEPPQPRGPGGIAGMFPGVPGGVTGFAQDEPACKPTRSGYHLNRSSYFLRDGTFVPKGTRWVKNRKMNKANGRANDKAITRLEGGQKQAIELLKSTGYRTVSKQSAREIRHGRKAAFK